jgi:Cu2+-exporting ATPase
MGQPQSNKPILGGEQMSKKYRFTVTGMSCAACSARVEKCVSALPNVSVCSVNLLSASMTVEGNVSASDIIKSVEDAGYGAALNDGKINRNVNNILHSF